MERDYERNRHLKEESQVIQLYWWILVVDNPKIKCIDGGLKPTTFFLEIEE